MQCINNNDDGADDFYYYECNDGKYDNIGDNYDAELLLDIKMPEVGVHFRIPGAHRARSGKCWYPSCTILFKLIEKCEKQLIK